MNQNLTIREMKTAVAKQVRLYRRQRPGFAKAILRLAAAQARAMEEREAEEARRLGQFHWNK